MFLSRHVISVAVVVLSSSLAAIAAPARVELVPVRASGPNVISGNEITLQDGGQRVWFELRLTEVEGLTLIRGYEIDVDLRSLMTRRPLSPTAAIQPCESDGDCATTLGFGWGGYCGNLCTDGSYSFAECSHRNGCGGANCGQICFPGFVEVEREDRVLDAPDAVTGTALGPELLQIRFFAGFASAPSVVDTSRRNYIGTIAIDVPASWVGSVNLGFDPLLSGVYIPNDRIPGIQLELVPGRIAVPCRNDMECTDGDSCTLDRCEPGTHDCTNPLNHDPSTACCDPSSGVLSPIVDDPDDCIEVLCDRTTGIVSKRLAYQGAGCRVEPGNSCGIRDHCDANGHCLAGSVPNGTRCDDQVFCNGLEYCWDNQCVTGENPCGEGTCNEGEGVCEGGRQLAHLLANPPGQPREITATRRGTIRLVFDREIVLPRTGELDVLSIYGPCENGQPRSSSVTQIFPQWTERTADGRARVFALEDSRQRFKNGEWYMLRNVGNWPGVAPFEAPFLIKRGDADGDGRVNVIDLVEIARHIPSIRPLTETSRRFDINGDGVVNSADLATANLYVPSPPSPYPCPP